MLFSHLLESGRDFGARQVSEALAQVAARRRVHGECRHGRVGVDVHPLDQRLHRQIVLLEQPIQDAPAAGRGLAEGGQAPGLTS